MKKLIFLAVIAPFFAFAQEQTDANLITQNNTTVRQVTLASKPVANMFKTVVDSKISKLSNSLTSNFSIAQSGNTSISLQSGLFGLTLLAPSTSINTNSELFDLNTTPARLRLDAGVGLIFEDKRGTPTGLQYNADYSANFTARSLVDKNYVDNRNVNTFQTLSDAATTTWNFSLGNSAQWTVAGNRTLSITNVSGGVPTFGTVKVIQDAIGGRTVTLPGNSNDVLLRTAANAQTTLSFYWDGTAYYWTSSLKGDAFLANTQTFTGKNTFTPNATSSGINVGSFAGNPSTLTNGDLWYNSTTNTFNGQISAATQTLATLAGTQTFTNKTLSTGTTISAIPTISAGIKLTMSPNATNAGLNTGSFAGDPSTLVNGDIWYNSTTNNFNGRINAATQTFATLAGTQTFTNKTLSTGTTISAIPTISAGIKLTMSPNATNAGINAGSFAGDPSTLVNGDLWYNSTSNALRGRINGVSTDLTIPNLFSTTVTISSAQILNSFTTPIQLVPAQGAGNVIIPVQIVMSLTFGGTGYTGNTNTQIQLNATNVASVSGYIGNTANGFINLDLPQVALSAGSANVPLNFTTQTGNPSAGNGTLRVFVLYRIVTL